MKKLVFFLIIAFCSTHCMADKLDENDNEDENHRNIFQPQITRIITDNIFWEHRKTRKARKCHTEITEITEIFFRMRELRSSEVFCPSEIVSELSSSAAQIPSITLWYLIRNKYMKPEQRAEDVARTPENKLSRSGSKAITVSAKQWHTHAYGTTRSWMQNDISVDKSLVDKLDDNELLSILSQRVCKAGGFGGNFNK